MGIKLISFLGTSIYQPIDYQIGEDCYHTHFIQEALIRHILKTLPEGETLTVQLLLTESARNRNYDGTEIVASHPDYRRLADILETFAQTIVVETMAVPVGQSEAEIWAIFDQVVDNLEDGDHIFLDITHGFRSLPLMASAIIGYVEQIYQAITLEEIFYGAFESRSPEGVAPVFLLEQFYTLQKWSTATDKFLKGGQGDIIPLIKKELNQLKRRYKGDDPLLNLLDRLQKNLDYFIQSVKTNRTQDSIKYALVLKKCFAQMETTGTNDYHGLRPFLRILQKINTMVADFREDDLIWNIHCIVKLCFSFGMYQQVFTLLGENGTNCLLALSQTDQKDFLNRNIREKVRKDYFDYYKWRTPNEAMVMVDEKFFHQRYANFILNSFRNDVNHAGLSVDAVDWRSVVNNAEKSIALFEELFLKEVCQN